MTLHLQLLSVAQSSLRQTVRESMIELLNLTDYDPSIAQHFASLSSATYCGNTTGVLDWTCQACVDSATPLVPGKIRIIDSGTKNATRVIVGKLKDQHGCLMIFRGSDNVQNFITDLDAWEIKPTDFVDCKGCRVHSGFYQIWEQVQDEVMAAIHDVGCAQYRMRGHNPDNLLYITGHSLGAALTHLAMFTLNNAGWNISKTYSFEAPRIGNNAFSVTRLTSGLCRCVVINLCSYGVGCAVCLLRMYTCFTAADWCMSHRRPSHLALRGSFLFIESLIMRIPFHTYLQNRLATSTSKLKSITMRMRTTLCAKVPPAGLFISCCPFVMFAAADVVCAILDLLFQMLRTRIAQINSQIFQECSRCIQRSIAIHRWCQMVTSAIQWGVSSQMVLMCILFSCKSHSIVYLIHN